MAISNLELQIIYRLRIKVSDNPVVTIDSSHLGKSLYVISDAGIELKTITTADYGFDTFDTASQIWSNSELQVEINSALVTGFKGRKNSIAVLNELEIEILILLCAYSLMLALAVDASKYVKYTTKDIKAEKLSPSQFIQIANSYKARVKDLAEESSELTGFIGTVKQSTLRIANNIYNKIIPENVEPTLKVPDMFFTIDGTKVTITIPYSFVVTFKSLTLKKTPPSGDTVILGDWYVLAERVIEDVVSAGTTKYTLYLENVNGQIFKREGTVAV